MPYFSKPLLYRVVLPTLLASIRTNPTHSFSALQTNRFFSSSTTKLHTSPYGIDMDQNDMMESDTLITVSSTDEVVSLSSPITKKQAHSFTKSQPRGIAHRAFSVFLFNSENKLLLTKRASTKITFPDVWTNTCCSHPLCGMTPCEVDDVEKVFPDFPGTKHAAIRKLHHELGIRPEDVPHDLFRFLTRFHYWAADTQTYGSNAPWGEHEIDYVLFIQCDTPEVELNVNPEEVDEIRYVSAKELKEMMTQENLKWSPWFQGIMEHGGYVWWDDLEEALREDSKFVNRDITFFDPPKEFWAEYNLENHGKETGVLSLKEEVGNKAPL